jgi:hypothetical protein
MLTGMVRKAENITLEWFYRQGVSKIKIERDTEYTHLYVESTGYNSGYLYIGFSVHGEITVVATGGWTRGVDQIEPYQYDILDVKSSEFRAQMLELLKKLEIIGD